MGLFAIWQQIDFGAQTNLLVIYLFLPNILSLHVFSFACESDVLV